MTSVDYVTLEVADPARAEEFYATAFGPEPRVRVRASDASTNGFRAFSLSLAVAQPADVDAFVERAVAAGATTTKPPVKSMWGYGGVVQAPDGTIWNFATSRKKNTGPATGHYSEIILLIGATDVPASKKFYVEKGFVVEKSYGRSYVQFALPASPLKFGLYSRSGLAKASNVAVEGSGSHRVAIATDGGAFSDPDGFVWDSSSR